MLRTVALVALWLLPAAAVGNTLLPRPPELEPAVRFWSRIYSQVDGNGGLIHDNVHMDVVYEELRFPSGLSERGRERMMERRKDEIRAVLRRLAGGKRSGLSREETRVLSRWPTGTANATLRSAANRLRFQLGQADKFRAGLVRQGAWKAHIERVLQDHGVPGELVALPHVESSYNARAYSRVGAAGLWQFTRSTGRRYLRIDSAVDERLDPFAATRAAARLLRDNYRRLEAWPLAITAYNHGPSGIARAVRATGSRDIARIVERYESRTFGFASRNFYAEFLAASEIDRNPERYFGALRRERPVRYQVVELPHFFPAASLARALGVDTEVLREHNNALRPAVWSGAKYVPKGFALRLPQQLGKAPLEVALARIPAAERLDRQHRDRLYKVRRGDSLSAIARRYGVRESELMALNNLRSRHRIRAGAVLVLPDDAGGPTLWATPHKPPKDGVYRVRRGDALSTIARRYGVSEAELVAWNGLKSRHRISVGQQLRVAVPDAAAPVVLAAAPAPVKPEPAATAPTAEPAAAEPEPPAPLVLASRDGPASDSDLDLDGDRGDAAAPAAAAEAPRPEPPRPPAAGELVAAMDFERVVDAPIEPEPEPAPELADEDPAIEPEPTATARAGAPPNPDPSTYAVGPDHRITVQAEETLGHYAEWLEVRASQLRRLNGMRRGSTVVIGRPARLDFSRVRPETFERRRLEYHRTLQQEFFGSFRVTGTERHVLRRGDTLWGLARERYEVPVWLLRQYNPDLDFGTLAPGSTMLIPRIEARAETARDSHT